MNWIRLRTIFQTNTLNVFAVGISAIVVGYLGLQDRTSGLSSRLGSFFAGSDIPSTFWVFLASYSAFFIAGIMYSISVPSNIATYDNKGAFLASYFTSDENELADAREEWETDLTEYSRLRWTITLLLTTSLLLLGAAVLSLFDILPEVRRR